MAKPPHLCRPPGIAIAEGRASGPSIGLRLRSTLKRRSASKLVSKVILLDLLMTGYLVCAEVTPFQR